MCVTTYCIYPWLPDSIIVSVALSLVAGLISWKLIKALIDSIPVVG